MARSAVSPAEFGGYPLLDDSFARDRALVAVACARCYRLTGHGRPTADELRRVLLPEEAVRVRRLDLDLPMESSELTAERALAVSAALESVRRAVPTWAPLLDVPWRFRQLEDGGRAIGASTFAWPQHVFLGDRAFASHHELTEQLVHELSHGWLYLLEELSPLQHEGCTRLITLPSGTSERGVSELLGALHVVANLRRLWRGLDVDEESRAHRLAALDAYFTDALRTLTDTQSCLTAEGAALSDRLRRAA